jgi:hypothetical protein
MDIKDEKTFRQRASIEAKLASRARARAHFDEAERLAAEEGKTLVQAWDEFWDRVRQRAAARKASGE